MRGLVHQSFILGLVLSLLLSLCHGLTYHIPLKRSVNHDRHESHRDRVTRDVNTNEKLFGHSGNGYYMTMLIGTPPQKINVLIDTGSSNLAIAAVPDINIDKHFVRINSSTYEEDGREVQVPYTQGEWKGLLGTDDVQLTVLPNITVRPNIAFITQSQNFFINGSEWQGIVGMAYESIARPDSSIVPFFNSLVKDGGVRDIFAVQLCGTPYLAEDDKMGGSMTIGGLSSDLYNSEIYYTPLQKLWYYEVLITDIAVDSNSLGLDCKEYNFDRTIVDTGTTNMRFPKRVYKSILNHIQHKIMERPFSPSFWSGDEVMCWEDAMLPFQVFPTISLSMYHSENSLFKLHIPSEKYLRMVIDPFETGKCFKFGIASSEAGTVLGAILMEGYYVVFDRENKRVGFATSPCNAVYNNHSKPAIEGYINSTENLKDCYYIKPASDQSSMLIVAYVMAAICCICVLPLIIMIIQWQYRRSCGNHSNDEEDDGNLIER
ncbi:hypothetical protein LOTGIDRAFT_125352 [Lottia gigantea]|uniref:Peptidase A1 domain-containing protein n=1 Tax=Lottia gigantea TaxID=225164 RepID=V4A3M0_LOTGI|nr:hypothetical protein LOTGIDRAFT_125352 [Lottia gigantea]ESO89560.1 hypothetical protein LOTGIDRAFT_125352 [Lottia gigantea]